MRVCEYEVTLDQWRMYICMLYDVKENERKDTKLDSWDWYHFIIIGQLCSLFFSSWLPEPVSGVYLNP